ncbi:MAG TPA: hypothetical protein VM389_01885, partial [Phycisphaerae bacterium]|nr:hypothetical protein [Phycisphaerae bacterium]
MPTLKVIARFRSGRLVKGTTWNFQPGVAVFHVTPLEDGAGHEPIEVVVNELKALFMVRDLEGDPNRHSRPAFLPGQKACGHKLRVTFLDGEVVEGGSVNYDRTGQGFFLFPADEGGNNERIYVINASASQVETIPETPRMREGPVAQSGADRRGRLPPFGGQVPKV